MKRRIAVLVVTVGLASIPLRAVLGVGDIVFDPISYANALVMLAELIKNYEQLKAQLDLQTWLSKMVPVDMSSRYRTVGTSWYGLQLPFDRFGNLSAWLQAVNEGGGAMAGYGAVSVALEPYGYALSRLAPEEQLKAANQYASAEIADGTNVHSMETIGMLRGNADAVEQSIQSLEDDSLSLDPAMNTEIAVLNKINAASIANLRSTRDTNRVLLSVLEQQVSDSKLRRDAHVSEINSQIRRLAKGPEEKAKYSSTITQSLQSFRWK